MSKRPAPASPKRLPVSDLTTLMDKMSERGIALLEAEAGDFKVKLALMPARPPQRAPQPTLSPEAARAEASRLQGEHRARLQAQRAARMGVSPGTTTGALIDDVYQAAKAAEPRTPTPDTSGEPEG
ncbi:MAG TPA: hypothetical protein VF765_30940 [Polyangiaceae bacterium]